MIPPTFNTAKERQEYHAAQRTENPVLTDRQRWSAESQDRYNAKELARLKEAAVKQAQADKLKAKIRAIAETLVVSEARYRVAFHPDSRAGK